MRTILKVFEIIDVKKIMTSFIEEMYSIIKKNADKRITMRKSTAPHEHPFWSVIFFTHPILPYCLPLFAWEHHNYIEKRDARIERRTQFRGFIPAQEKGESRYLIILQGAEKKFHLSFNLTVDLQRWKDKSIFETYAIKTLNTNHILNINSKSNVCIFVLWKFIFCCRYLCQISYEFSLKIFTVICTPSTISQTHFLLMKSGILS